MCGFLTIKAAAYLELLSKEVIGGIAIGIPVAEGLWGVWSDIAVDVYSCCIAEHNQADMGWSAEAETRVRPTGSKPYIVSL